MSPLGIADALESDAVGTALKGVMLAGAEQMKSWAGYEHPYGFQVLHSDRDPFGRVVRLHWWKEDPAKADEYLIHDHVYHLKSFVLTGSIVQTRYIVCSEGEPTHREYRGIYGTNTSTVVPTNILARLSGIGVDVVAAGETYALPPGSLHSVRVERGKNTATLVLATFPEKAPEPLIFGPIPEPTPVEFYRRPLTCSEKEQLVQEIISLKEFER